LGFVETHLQDPTKDVGRQQHFHKITKGGLVVVFERVDDHTVIFGNDDVVKGIQQNRDEEIDNKDEYVLFHKRDQNAIDT
jgi:hypothetical protein